MRHTRSAKVARYEARHAWWKWIALALFLGAIAVTPYMSPTEDGSPTYTRAKYWLGLGNFALAVGIGFGYANAVVVRDGVMKISVFYKESERIQLARISGAAGDPEAIVLELEDGETYKIPRKRVAESDLARLENDLERFLSAGVWPS